MAVGLRGYQKSVVFRDRLQQRVGDADRHEAAELPERGDGAEDVREEAHGRGEGRHLNGAKLVQVGRGEPCHTNGSRMPKCSVASFPALPKLPDAFAGSPGANIDLGGDTLTTRPYTPSPCSHARPTEHAFTAWLYTLRSRANSRSFFSFSFGIVYLFLTPF